MRLPIQIAASHRNPGNGGCIAGSPTYVVARIVPEYEIFCDFDAPGFAMQEGSVATNTGIPAKCDPGLFRIGRYNQ